jgi:hypothetical protein
MKSGISWNDVFFSAKMSQIYLIQAIVVTVENHWLFRDGKPLYVFPTPLLGKEHLMFLF